MMGSTRLYTENSTGSIPDSCFWVHDFQLGASMVVVQPSSGKVLLVNNTERRTWFLPRGRKDIGETLEQCALREAYEEVRTLTATVFHFSFLFVVRFVSTRGWRAMRAKVSVCAAAVSDTLTCKCAPPSFLFPPPLPPFSPLRATERMKFLSDVIDRPFFCLCI
jgi:ADP-ribose pyrophosphatase YjhB (NUDIX family)